MNPCLTCGFCCLCRIPLGVNEDANPNADYIRRHEGELYRDACGNYYLAPPGCMRCQHLEGEPGVKVACLKQDDKPAACVALKAGSDFCNRVRASNNLPPI